MNYVFWSHAAAAVAELTSDACNYTGPDTSLIYSTDIDSDDQLQSSNTAYWTAVGVSSSVATGCIFIICIVFRYYFYNIF